MDMWRVLQGGHVEGLTGWTGAPVEDPPDLKNVKYNVCKNLETKLSFCLDIIKC